MKHLLEFFKDVIPIIFVVGIIAVCFLFYTRTKSLSSSGLNKTYAFDAELEHSDILVYDGMTVSGNDVIGFAKKYYKARGTTGAFDIIISNFNGGSAITSNTVSNIGSATLYSCVVSMTDGLITSVKFTKK